jgi:hypothetical protein
VPDLCVVSARPVSVSRNGKVKARKRKRNDLSVLSVVPGLYPGGSSKLAKDATTDPFGKKKRKAKAKKRAAPRKRANAKKKKDTGWKIKYSKEMKRWYRDGGVQRIYLPKGWEPTSKANRKPTKRKTALSRRKKALAAARRRGR